MSADPTQEPCTPRGSGRGGVDVARVGWVFTGLAVLMVPWTVYLFLSLPSTAPAVHYDLAWGGFDVGLVVMLALTGVAAVRRSSWLVAVSGGTAALLLADAWFDVVMAAGLAQRWMALTMAALVELPLALVCGWLAVQGHELLERRLHWAERPFRRNGHGLPPGH